MPINKKEGEQKSDYIGRCISHYVKKGRTQEQAAAICYSNWETMATIEKRLRIVREYRYKDK